MVQAGETPVLLSVDEGACETKGRVPYVVQKKQDRQSRIIPNNVFLFSFLIVSWLQIFGLVCGAVVAPGPTEQLATVVSEAASRC